MSKYLKSIPLLAILISSFQLDAQIVNIEDKRTIHADSSAWFGRLDLGFNLIENGSSIISARSGMNIEYVNGRHWFLSLTNFNFFQADKRDFVNDGFQHLRYNFRINKYLSYEAFTQAQYNEKLNLRLRWLLGTGLRLTLLDKAKQRAYLGLTYMYEFNRETKPEMDFRDNRMSIYASVVVQPFKNTKLSNTTYYQPVLNNFNDLRLSSKTVLAINFTAKLLFTTTFNITYDSRVPEEVANTIYSLRNGIRWNF